jgi:lipoprotein-anchoring transpeptidase ErfK/SrfK
MRLCVFSALVILAPFFIGSLAHAERNTQAMAGITTNFAHGAYGYKADPRYDKRQVSYTTAERPGTIIIETRRRFLYLVLGSGQALRYGIGVGRYGFTWQGTEHITHKAEWPDWHPPKEMLARDPDLPEFMEGGPKNPLGARALYLGASEYRIHGTAQPWTIGQAVSSGCIRLTNDNVIDLYNRARVGAKVIVQ